MPGRKFLTALCRHTLLTAVFVKQQETCLRMCHFPHEFAVKETTLAVVEAWYRLVRLSKPEGGCPAHPWISCAAVREMAAIRQLALGLKKACLAGKQTVI